MYKLFCYIIYRYKVVDVTALTPWTKIVGGKSAVNSVKSCKYCFLKIFLSHVLNSGGGGKYIKTVAVCEQLSLMSLFTL